MATETRGDLQPLKRSQSYDLLPPNLSELRVVLLGNSWSQRSSVGNFILGEKHFNTEEEPDCCLRASGGLKEKQIVLINTPDLLQPNISEDKLTQHVEHCRSLCGPGPHVFLLVLQPEEFTEELKEKLCRVLKLFSDQSLDHSLILISTPREETSGFTDKDQPLEDMIQMSQYRYLWQKNLGRPELFTRFTQIVKENKGELVRCDKFEDEGLNITPKSDHRKPSLNLVLSGRTGAGKTSAAKATGRKEKEEEMKRREEHLQRKHEDDLKSLKNKFKEDERKLKAKQLEDLNKEREERRKEREEEKRRWKKQEDAQRQDWRRKLEASEKIVWSEREQKENAIKKMGQLRKETKRDQEAWNKDKKDIWERIHQEDKQSLEEAKKIIMELHKESHRRRKWTYAVGGLLCLLFVLHLIFMR